MGSGFSFRRRFEVMGSHLPFGEESIELARHGTAVVELRSRQRKPIRDSTELSIWGTGFADTESAHSAGLRWTSVVQRGLAALGVPANFGSRNPSLGGFTPLLVDHVEQKLRETLGTGEGVAVYSESWDLMVFPSEPPPIFASGGAAGFAIRAPEHVALRAFEASAGTTEPVDRVAADLLGASARVAHIADARLVLLVMALESLATRMQRPQVSRDHIDQLVELTKESEELDPLERTALVNALGSLKSESIAGALRRLSGQLDPTSYPFDPTETFKVALRMRNNLAHGGERPDLNCVRETGARLELLVADLIAGQEVTQMVKDARGAGA